jgi:hypothetical protein
VRETVIVSETPPGSSCRDAVTEISVKDADQQLERRTVLA